MEIYIGLLLAVSLATIYVEATCPNKTTILGCESQEVLNEDQFFKCLNCLETQLHAAVREGNISVIENLILEGADMYAVNCEGLTPIQIAVISGNREVIYTFARNKFDVNKRICGNTTLLHFAVRNGTTESIDCLIELGSILNAEDALGGTPLFDSVLFDKMDAFDVLSRNGASVSWQSPSHQTYLHKATERGSLKVLMFFAKKLELKYYDIVDDARKTALTIAVERNEPALGNFLIAKGANKMMKGDFGNSYLHLACLSKSPNSTWMLLEQGLEPEARNAHEQTPKESAVKSDDLESLIALKSYGVDIFQKTYYNSHLLHLSALYGSPDCLKWLICQGFDVDMPSPDEVRRPPLHIAAREGHLDVVNILLDHGANVNSRDGNINTPLYYAVESSEQEVAELLRSKGGVM